jgi:hypothetical protein
VSLLKPLFWTRKVEQPSMVEPNPFL